MEQVSTMFATLEKIAQSDPKNTDIILIENYAAFQNRLPLVFDLHKFHKFGLVHSVASYVALSVILCALGSKKVTICYCFMQSLRLG